MDLTREKHLEINLLRHALLKTTSYSPSKVYYFEKWMFAMALIEKRRPDLKEHVHNQVLNKVRSLFKEQDFDIPTIKRLLKLYIRNTHSIPPNT